MFIKGMREIPRSEVQVNASSPRRFIYKNTGKWVTGYLIQYSGDVLYSKRGVHYGLYQGLSCIFSRDGSLRYLNNYVKGRREGFQISFLRNDGRAISHYKEGKRDGCCKEYDKFGNLLYEENWKDGLRHGSCKEYLIDKTFNSSILIDCAQYRKDKCHGRRETYDDEGNLKYVFKYENGHPTQFFDERD